MHHRRSLALTLGLLAIPVWSARAQHHAGGAPLTRAERTDYRETSRYADVMAFVDALDDMASWIRVTSFGYSVEGRRLPLVVVGEVDAATPEAVRASGKTRVFVQANIHAGEVCGKEAAQMLLRQLALGAHAEWRDSLVLLVAPIYNVDGNERVRLDNRRGQHGPVGGMGQRANAQGLDLNRDHMKLESPEARSLAALMTDWDPHVLLDLHTTNGTRRAYQLLYAPPLHPETAAGIDSMLRSKWLPAVTERIATTDGWAFFFYGNVPFRPGVERGWYTFDHRPRFNTNYIGLRNRFGILSEAYAYETFEMRVQATLRFVEEVIDFAHRHAGPIRAVTEQADAAELAGTAFAVRATYSRGDSVEILLGEVAEERHPYTGRPMYRRLDVVHPERMPDFGRFTGTETVAVPEAYVVPTELSVVIERLRAHGVEVEPLAESEHRSLERFRIDSTVVAGREFQGHRERTVYGAYERTDETLPAGTVLVRTRQPLGKLVVALLEPRSDDGLANWNVLDGELEGAEYYPIRRLPVP
jgi:hypothetical protein